MTDLPLDLTPLILHGHVVDMLRSLPANSFQLGVTSPPYWGARSYVACGCSLGYERDPGQAGAHPHRRNPARTRLLRKPDPSCRKCGGTGRLLSITDPVWGGDPGCAHRWAATPPRRSRALDDAGGELQQNNVGASYDAKGGKLCTECGAWMGMLGDEPTPQMFVRHLAEDVCDEVRRVLRPDGVFFLNLGDTRTTHPAGNVPRTRWDKSWMNTVDRTGQEQAGAVDKTDGGLPEKNLAGIPHRVAIALQDRGWYLRSDIVWNKPNPGRSSAKDRPCDSHEYIFMLTKEPEYFYSEEAGRQPYVPSTIREIDIAYRNESSGLYERNGAQDPSDKKRSIMKKLRDRGGSMLPDVWTFPTNSWKRKGGPRHYATFPPTLPKICISVASRPDDLVIDPFSGSFTTGEVAIALGRRFVGIDLNPEYIDRGRARLAGVAAPEDYRPSVNRLGAEAAGG